MVLGRGGDGYYQGALYVSVKSPRNKLKYFLKEKAEHGFVIPVPVLGGGDRHIPDLLDS